MKYLRVLYRGFVASERRLGNVTRRTKYPKID